MSRAQYVTPLELEGQRPIPYELQHEGDIVLFFVQNLPGIDLLVYDVEKQQLRSRHDLAYNAAQPILQDEEIFILFEDTVSNELVFEVRDTAFNLLQSSRVEDDLISSGFYPRDVKRQGDTINYLFSSNYPARFALLRFSTTGLYLDEWKSDTTYDFDIYGFEPAAQGYWFHGSSRDAVFGTVGHEALLLKMDDSLELESFHVVLPLELQYNPFQTRIQRVIDEMVLESDSTVLFSGTAMFSSPSLQRWDGYVARYSLEDSSLKERQFFTPGGAYSTQLMRNPLFQCNEEEYGLVYSSATSSLFNELYGLDSYVGFARLNGDLEVIQEDFFLESDSLYQHVASAVLTDAGQIVAVGLEADLYQSERWRTFIMNMDCNGQLLDVSYVDEPKQGLQIYPNPTKDICTIQAASEVLEVLVIDLNGRVVLRASSAQLDIGALPRGMYSVHVTTADGSFTEKVVRE